MALGPSRTGLDTIIGGEVVDRVLDPDTGLVVAGCVPASVVYGGAQCRVYYTETVHPSSKLKNFTIPSPRYALLVPLKRIW
jgi:hypothetical protein